MCDVRAYSSSSGSSDVTSTWQSQLNASIQDLKITFKASYDQAVASSLAAASSTSGGGGSSDAVAAAVKPVIADLKQTLQQLQLKFQADNGNTPTLNQNLFYDLNTLLAAQNSSSADQYEQQILLKLNDLQSSLTQVMLVRGCFRLPSVLTLNLTI